MRKRLFSVCLILALTVTLLPLGQATAYAASGSCGSSLKWSFSPLTGELKITGSGKMYDYMEHSSLSPWRTYASLIRLIQLPAGLTHIGDFAFPGSALVSQVTIPDSVKTIGWGAFADCKRLKQVKIGSGVTEICGDAFVRCGSLAQVSVPANVKSIGWGAFSECGSLKKAVLANGVQQLGGFAFYTCPKLETITIPASLTNIGLNAFLDTKWLDSKPNGVVYIGKLAYTAKGNLSGALTLKAGTTVISEEAFSNQTKLTSVTIPSSVKKISMRAFSGCSGLSKVTIQNGPTEIGTAAFQDCGKLKEISFPASVKTIGIYAFQNCASLSKISFGGGVSKISGSAFENCDALTNVSIPGNVTIVGDRAFADCAKLNKVTFAAGVSVIEEYAFYGSKALKSVSIPASVKRVGNYALGFSQGAYWGVHTKTGSFTISAYAASPAAQYAKERGLTLKTLGAVALKSAAFTTASATLGVGQTKQLTLSITPTNATYRYTQYFTFKTGNASVATVSASGLITAKGAGTTTVTAVDTLSGKIKASCKITVKAAPTGVKLNKTSITLGAAETFKPTATVSPSSAAGTRSWSSSNSAVAKVDSGGKITALKAGKATVTVKTHNGKTARITVTVKPAPTSVKLNPSSATLNVKKTLTPTVTLNSGAACSQFIWSSSNSAVAKVSASGKITAVKAGKATITVKTYNGKTARVYVTVR